LLGLAIIGGEGPDAYILKEIAYSAASPKGDISGVLLAAADSGLALAEAAGLRPDWVLGDMDSLDDSQRLEKYPPDRVLSYPPDKDFSDTELALNLLREKGCDEIWLAGGGGGRTDHLLAIHSLFERPSPPDRWFTAREEIFCLKDGHTLNSHMLVIAAACAGNFDALRSAARKSPVSSRVSVFPLSEGPWEAESAGLKWPLKALPWNKGFYGLSNEAENGAFEIRSVRGRFLVIVGF